MIRDGASAWFTGRKTVRGCNSVVECQLPKLDVVGSNPIARSNSNSIRRYHLP